MNVVIVGSAGREHALGLALRRSGATIVSVPGNAGLQALGTCAPESELLDLARGADLVVIGPEAPLVDGLADRIRALGIPVFGPSKAAARIEGSKTFMREVAQSAGVKIAHGESFDDPDKAAEFVSTLTNPAVVKADGLAAGKGVFVCSSVDDAIARIDEIMRDRIFGEAGTRVVVEEKLVGRETSVLALCDSVRTIALPAAQDFKRAFDNDQGLNTGGMGSYSPVEWHTDGFVSNVMTNFIDPVVRELSSRGAPFIGCVFAGIMVTNDGPVLLEINGRFGDPETQSILPLLDEDLGELLLACATGNLGRDSLRVRNESAVTVVMASGGYPGAYETGFPIEGLVLASAMPGVTVHHAGTKCDGDQIVTDGGRVLGVTGVAPTTSNARELAYRAASAISYKEAFYRRDIAASGQSPAPVGAVIENLS